VIEKLSTEKLLKRLEAAEEAGDWPMAERIEAELDRRDYDAGDPASPQNTQEDTPALDPPWWEYR
jgi:hypothetical protein